MIKEPKLAIAVEIIFRKFKNIVKKTLSQLEIDSLNFIATKQIYIILC